MRKNKSVARLWLAAPEDFDSPAAYLAYRDSDYAVYRCGNAFGIHTEAAISGPSSGNFVASFPTWAGVVKFFENVSKLSFEDLRTEAGIWTSSNGLINLSISREDFMSVPCSGPADDHIAELMNKDRIRAEFGLIDDKTLCEELSGHGTWSVEELGCRKDNIARILWIACLDLQEEKP